MQLTTCILFRGLPIYEEVKARCSGPTLPSATKVDRTWSSWTRNTSFSVHSPSFMNIKAMRQMGAMNPTMVCNFMVSSHFSVCGKEGYHVYPDPLIPQCIPLEIEPVWQKPPSPSPKMGSDIVWSCPHNGPNKPWKTMAWARGRIWRTLFLMNAKIFSQGLSCGVWGALKADW